MHEVGRSDLVLPAEVQEFSGDSRAAVVAAGVTMQDGFYLWQWTTGMNAKIKTIELAWAGGVEVKVTVGNPAERTGIRDVTGAGRPGKFGRDMDS